MGNRRFTRLMNAFSMKIDNYAWRFPTVSFASTSR
jgi:hypothetical protein